MKSVLHDIRRRGHVDPSAVPKHLWFTVLKKRIDSIDFIAGVVFTEIVWPES